jgi:hypothetical protein
MFWNYGFFKRRKKGSTHSPFFFFGFCLMVLTGLAHSSLAQSRSDIIFIDPEDPSQLIRTQIPFNPQVLLKTKDLPHTIAAHPAVYLENERFTFIVSSPDHKTLAFCVDAQIHDWTGLLDLASGAVKQLGLSYESEAGHPNFSEDSRYLSLEESQSQGRKGLEVFNLENGTECRLDGRQARDKFLNFSDIGWSPEGDRMYFKVEYNNNYRTSLGLRPKQFPTRIAEATPECGKVRYYSVAEFMEKHPDQAHHSDLALQKVKGD